MLPRVLEPEVMDSAEEAEDYDAIDHDEVNTRFCEDVLARRPSGPLLDVGTGTARIPVEICRRADVEVVAVDLSEQMIAVARRNVSAAGLSTRITLARMDAKRLTFEEGAFGATLSNSIVHHSPEPGRVLAEIWRVTRSGGLVFVRDLVRPESSAEIERLVQRYGGPRPASPALAASYERQRELFRASLGAALTVEEVRAMAEPLGIPREAVSRSSDRHWTLAVQKP